MVVSLLTALIINTDIIPFFFPDHDLIILNIDLSTQGEREVRDIGT